MDNIAVEHMAPMAPVLGNTKPRPKRQGAAVKWVFTLNNWTQEEFDILKNVGSKILIIGKEVAPTTGTPHLQGYIEFKKKERPKELIKIDRIHWEIAKGTRESNLAYCTKQDANAYVFGIKVLEKIVDPLDGLELRPWQTRMKLIVQGPPHPRQILWRWESIGNTGKSSFCKHLALTMDALVVSGKGDDIKYFVSTYIEKTKKFPKIIILDLPRTSEGFVCWSTIEQLKNGMFFSGKYESNMVMFNDAHVIIFANFAPNEMDRRKLSADRWNIEELV